MSSHSKAKGFVTFRSISTTSKEVIREDKFPNAVLRVGRRDLVASLGGVSKSGHVRITHIAIGTGGVDNFGNLLPVSEDQPGLIGGESSVKALIEAQVTLFPAPEASIMVRGILPSQSSANGHKMTQLGLVLSTGNYYAVRTWDGPTKDSSITNEIEWEVEIL